MVFTSNSSSYIFILDIVRMKLSIEDEWIYRRKYPEHKYIFDIQQDKTLPWSWRSAKGMVLLQRIRGILEYHFYSKGK